MATLGCFPSVRFAPTQDRTFKRADPNLRSLIAECETSMRNERRDRNLADPALSLGDLVTISLGRDKYPVASKFTPSRLPRFRAQKDSADTPRDAIPKFATQEPYAKRQQKDERDCHATRGPWGNPSRRKTSAAGISATRVRAGYHANTPATQLEFRPTQGDANIIYGEAQQTSASGALRRNWMTRSQAQHLATALTDTRERSYDAGNNSMRWPTEVGEFSLANQPNILTGQFDYVYDSVLPDTAETALGEELNPSLAISERPAQTTPIHGGGEFSPSRNRDLKSTQERATRFGQPTRAEHYPPCYHANLQQCARICAQLFLLTRRNFPPIGR